MTYKTNLKQTAIGAALCVLVGLFSGTAHGSEIPTDNGIPISAEFPFDKSYIEISGSRLAFVDVGKGPVVVFLHGNPTSSYLWRNIIPYVSKTHRAIAVDLIGMGNSGKPDIGYTFKEHAEYIDRFIQALDLKDITLVVHDWGSAIGMRYARLNPSNVRAMVFMEALIPPALPSENYEIMGEFTGTMFRALRTPGLGEDLVLNYNFFVESVLGRFGSGRSLTDAEMEVYRAPFAARESRIPTLVWPRQVPIGGKPADVAETIRANGKWLYESKLPKLFFHAQPGALIQPPVASYVIANAKNLTSVDLGRGSHFVQESSPHTIGKALATWLESLPR